MLVIDYTAGKPTAIAFVYDGNFDDVPRALQEKSKEVKSAKKSPQNISQGIARDSSKIIEKNYFFFGESRRDWRLMHRRKYNPHAAKLLCQKRDTIRRAFAPM